METTFVADYDYECPYCHDILDDIGEKKKCRGCKREFKSFKLGGEEIEKY